MVTVLSGIIVAVDLKLVQLQPNISTLHRNVGRDFTGKADLLALDAAKKEGLSVMNQLDVR